MAKIKFTKGELKKQRDSLAQLQHYLPTLQLKKQQLQIKVLEGRLVLARVKEQLGDAQRSLDRWVGLLADPQADLKPWIIAREVRLRTENVAGATLPVLEEVVFPQIDFDFARMPYWVDRGLKEMRGWIRLRVEIAVLEKRLVVLEQELRTTTQRVNLFEKVKIPECQENIRLICIYLGDQMANAVGISKVAKRKISEARNAEVLLLSFL